MKKAQKISYKDVWCANKDENNFSSIEYSNGEKKVEVIVKRKLSLEERSELVIDIANTVLRKNDDGSVVYAPYLFEFAVKLYIILYYTNIQMPKDPESIWEFVSLSPICDNVIDAISDNIRDIEDESKELISFNKASCVPKNKIDSIIDAVLDIITDTDEKIKSFSKEEIISLVSKIMPPEKEKSEE